MDDDNVRQQHARPVIAVFARPPVPGQAKTRLIPRLGPDGAAEFYLRMAHHTLATLALARPGQVEIWCAAEGDPCAYDACRRKLGVPLRLQCVGHLGKRMSHAAADILNRAGGAIIVGTDVPSMTRGDLLEACDALARGCDAVLGPAEDGGYYLIGLRRHAVDLFEGIQWGTSAVLEQQRMRLRALGWRWHELTTRWDVDTPADYERVLADPLLAPLAAAHDQLALG